MLCYIIFYFILLYIQYVWKCMEYVYIYICHNQSLFIDRWIHLLWVYRYIIQLLTHILQRKNYGINSIIHLHLSYPMFAGTRPATTRRRQASPPNFLKSTTGHSRISDLCIDPVSLLDYFLLDFSARGLGALFLQPWCSFEAWVHQHGARAASDQLDPGNRECLATKTKGFLGN